MTRSTLSETIDRLTGRAASAVVARSRLNAPALNAVLLRRLAVAPGNPDSLIADPVFEAARIWKTAPCCLGDLAGNLLHPDLVAALDGAATERMPPDRQPFVHQLEAWQTARDGLSFLVTSGTGSGKTECFMIPMLDGLLRDPAKGRLTGVRGIIVYPLNALIESQRERLAAWTEQLQHRVRFALYNGMTPETPRKVTRPPAAAEIADRRSIRESPPAILVTNVTMLEYLLLRAQDRDILERSQGLLRWIVLDEAHSYIGAQAAEMALLLRRVRAAFGVAPEEVRLIAASATISEGPDTREKLSRFVSELAGQDVDRVRVIEGRDVNVPLPAEGPDISLDLTELADRHAGELWKHLAPHPRVQRLKRAMARQGVTLTEAGEHLFGPRGAHRRTDTQAILDAAAAARDHSGTRLLPWRAHVFQRALGGVWVCVDPTCPHRDPELMAPDVDWGFGAIWLRQRDLCQCGGLVFELVACNECGTPHLRAGMQAGATARLVPLRAGEIDDFAVDAEPDPDEPGALAYDRVVVSPANGSLRDRFLQLNNGAIFDNAPPETARWTKIALIEDEAARNCCDGAAEARLQPLRYGPPFFLGNELPLLLEASAPLDKPGLPMGGRRALTFSDSRQGTARLAAKLQQEAERILTRAFLYHAVQEGRTPSGEQRAILEKKLAHYQTVPELFADDILRIEGELAGVAKPVPWGDLVDRLAQQAELRDFACEVWRERARGGREMAEDPQKLAAMFLYRELFRRPKVQNNPETMGLLRLVFPRLEERARGTIPKALQESGVDTGGWVGLVLAAIDFGFRDNLAVEISPEWMVRWIAPRGGWLRAMCSSGLAPQDRPEGVRPWPGPKPRPGNPSRLHRLIYALIDGDWDDRVDQDRAGEVLAALWTLITSTVARDVGRGAWRLDFRQAAVARLEQGWLCPVTRRVLGYSPAGRSPYDPAQKLTSVDFPLLPFANAGGLAPDQRAAMRDWCGIAPQLTALRSQGLWTNLHDRVAEYAPFLRAQEHSAQIDRSVLQIYEQGFKDGRINVLNCTTTMEMGVDIPNVALVVNANVPPSVSSYRQRVGRAGRRGEGFALSVTFCRDLPWDENAFATPPQYLTAPVSAPSVRLDSPALVTRHVHAALLGAFLRSQADGFNIKTSIGAFFGATEASEEPVAPGAPVDAFIGWLRTDLIGDDALPGHIAALTRSTALVGRDLGYLAAETAEALEALLAHWRAEYGELLARAAAAVEPEVKAAFVNRAKRMRGEFLLGELARRGFTPAYGFPVDVVSFDHLSGHDRDREDASVLIAFGERRGGASRTLDAAIREYAPGAEVVVDGLVHLSEGVLPAWGALADASGREDLQHFWECGACRAFGLARIAPEACPVCDAQALQWRRTLRPSGFLGRRAPHTGYENLAHVPYQMPRVRAANAPWQALPDPEMGRFRADPVGQVITLSSGASGCGYALCLFCGRAVAETEEVPNVTPAMPEAIRRHKPLATGRSVKLVAGYCPGGVKEPQQIQRNLRFVHDAQTDVFELQLPAGVTRAAGLAVAAVLREALAERLGTETREIGLAVAPSAGPVGDVRLSVFLHDRAAGGAGLVTRLAEPDWFSACLAISSERLDCPQGCSNGCPACVLRPDLNFAEERLDRRGGLALVRTLRARLDLPDALRVLGPQTRTLGYPLADWLDRQRRAGPLGTVTLFLHGQPTAWELAAWPITGVLARLREAGTVPRLVIDSTILTNSMLDMAQKLDLHRLTANAVLAHTPVMPMAGEASVLAVIEQHGRKIAIAAPDKAEAIPCASWGLGATRALVQGPAPTLARVQEFDSDRLVGLPIGDARLIRLANRLDGPVASFGRVFWNLLGDESPSAASAMKTHGVSSAQYTDRYLVTPLNLRLLFEVLNEMPGREPAQINVSTARLDRLERSGWAVFHPFPDDGQRRQVLQALLPKAFVDIRAKGELSHARSLTLTLGDGRRVILLLDQGFGAWRAETQARHDFGAAPGAQARALRAAVFKVRAEPTGELPIVIEEQPANSQR